MILPLSLRASSADQTFSCPATLLVRPRVKRTDDTEGDEGTEIHRQIAERAVKELGASAPPDGLGKPGKPLTPFAKWIPDWAIELLKERVPADWSLEVEMEVEARYELPRPVLVPLMEITSSIPEGYEIRDIQGRPTIVIDHFSFTGHLDWFAMSPDGRKSMGGDWKSGLVGADPADENWQAAVYLALCKANWPSLDESGFILGQPRIDEEAAGIPRVSTTTLSGEELDRLSAVLIEQVNTALENRYTTNSSPKACRYCALALTRPWDCPSLRKELEHMKATLTPEALAALTSTPDDGQLADFVVSGRTLGEPIKAATELLHKRLDAAGEVTSAAGYRITRKITKGDITVPDKPAFMRALKVVLPEEDRIAACVSPAKGDVIRQIAEARSIPQTSKDKMSATSVWDAHLAPLTVQGERRLLVIAGP